MRALAALGEKDALVDFEVPRRSLRDKTMASHRLGGIGELLPQGGVPGDEVMWDDIFAGQPFKRGGLTQACDCMK